MEVKRMEVNDEETLFSIVRSLKNEIAVKILSFVSKNDGATLSQVANEFGTSVTRIQQYVKVLDNMKLLKSEYVATKDSRGGIKRKLYLNERVIKIPLKKLIEN